MTVVRPNEYILQCDQNRFHSKRPNETCVIYALIGGFCFLMALASGVQLLHPVHSGATGNRQSLWQIPFLIVLGIAFVINAGPNELDCDLRQHTYRYRRMNKTLTGPLTDFNNLSIHYTAKSNRHEAEYWVCLVWKRPPSVFGFPQTEVKLVKLPDCETANKWMQELSLVLGFPSKRTVCMDL